MSPTAIALVLAAALLHSVWKIAAKKADGDDRFSHRTIAHTRVA